MPLKPLKTKQRLKAKIAEIKSSQHGYNTIPLAKRYAALAKSIKIRIPELEPFIMKDASAAVNYANEILKQPWPEAEPYILKSYKDAIEYTMLVKQKKWPELEKIIDGNPGLVNNYNYITRYLYS